MTLNDPTEPVVDPALWLKFGTEPNPSTREKMIMLAVEQIITRGPADFESSDICRQLGIKHPMVNHYFGSKANFLSETFWWAYQLWFNNFDSNIRTPKLAAKARLRKTIEGEIAIAARFGAMNILIQYPLISSEVLAIISEKHKTAMERSFEYYLATLTLCVSDIRAGRETEIDFTRDNIPKPKLLAKPKNFITATQIAWATHGLAMWQSGQHMATKGIEKRGVKGLTDNLSVGLASKQMIDTIIAMAD